jgi:Protein of unknown function (DUF3343)
MTKVIVVFGSTRAAIRAERACLAAGLTCQAIPVPLDISAGCGIALEIREQDRAVAEVVMRDTGIPDARFLLRTAKPDSA